MSAITPLDAASCASNRRTEAGGRMSTEYTRAPRIDGDPEGFDPYLTPDNCEYQCMICDVYYDAPVGVCDSAPCEPICDDSRDVSIIYLKKVKS